MAGLSGLRALSALLVAAVAAVESSAMPTSVPTRSVYTVLGLTQGMVKNGGLAVRVGTVEKHPSPLLVQDQPWEPRLDNGYPNVIPPSAATASWQLFYGDCVSGCGTQILLYANSTDGMVWHKPKLGLFDVGTVRPDLSYIGRPTTSCWREAASACAAMSRVASTSRSAPPATMRLVPGPTRPTNATSRWRDTHRPDGRRPTRRKTSRSAIQASSGAARATSHGRRPNVMTATTTYSSTRRANATSQRRATGSARRPAARSGSRCRRRRS